MRDESNEPRGSSRRLDSGDIAGCPIDRQSSFGAAPAFTPEAYSHPVNWPSAWKWLKTSRENALGLFPASCFEDLHVKHSIFGQKLVVLSDPESIAEITGSASGSFRLTNMHLRMLTPALGNGLIVAQDNAWRAHRRVSVKVIRRCNAAELTPFSEQRIESMIDRWTHSPDPVSIQPDLALLAIDLLVSEVFDHHFVVGNDRVKASIERHRMTVERADPLDMLGAPPWLASLRMRFARRIVRSFDGDIHKAIAASKTFSPPAGFNPDAQRDFVINIMSGFESVATTTTWLLGLIATEPRLQKWLRDPNVPKDVRTDRLDGAVLETMRLFPPLPLIYRQAVQDYDAPSGRIKRRSIVCFSPYIIQRHQALWENPLQFDPQRVLSQAKHSPFMPFGTGARQCVGKQLGPRLVSEIVRQVLDKTTLRSREKLPLPRAGLSLRPERPIMIDCSSV